MVEGLLAAMRPVEPSKTDESDIERLLAPYRPRTLLGIESEPLLSSSLGLLRQSREAAAPIPSIRILRVLIDELAVRAVTRSDALRLALRARAESHESLDLAGLSLRMVVRTNKRTTSNPRPKGYAFTNVFIDPRDDREVARIHVGLHRGRWTDWNRVKVHVTGQGCARGLLVPLLEHVAPYLLPESLRADADLAFDLDAPAWLLMMIDERRGRSALRRTNVRLDDLSHHVLGSTIEIGTRTGACSAILYDKLTEIRSPALEGHQQPMSALAASYALPPGPFEHCTRIEIRVRDVEPKNLEVALVRAAERVSVIDLRRVVYEHAFDELLVAQARLHGHTPTLPDVKRTQRTHAACRAAWTSTDAGTAERAKAARQRVLHGFAASVQASLLEARVAPSDARAHATAIADRLDVLLRSAAAATALDLGVPAALYLAGTLSTIMRALGVGLTSRSKAARPSGRRSRLQDGPSVADGLASIEGGRALLEHPGGSGSTARASPRHGSGSWAM